MPVLGLDLPDILAASPTRICVVEEKGVVFSIGQGKNLTTLSDTNLEKVKKVLRISPTSPTVFREASCELVGFWFLSNEGSHEPGVG